MIFSYIFWHRGTVHHPYSNAMATAKKNFSNPLQLVAALSIAGFISLGSYLFYQTNIINHYVTNKQVEQRAFDYEKNVSHSIRPGNLSCFLFLPKWIFSQGISKQLQRRN